MQIDGGLAVTKIKRRIRKSQTRLRILPFRAISGDVLTPGQRVFINLFIAFFVILVIYSQASASWLIDPKKYHASVHGQTACEDCHEEIQERDLHPNPEHISKKREDFFNVDQCVACHDNILDRLGAGFHGAKQIKEPEKYHICLNCHDPHEQPPIREEEGRFDPSTPRHEQCAACHEEQPELPPFSPEDEACMTCHRLLDPDDAEAEEKIPGICFHCHGDQGTEAQKLTAEKVPLIDRDVYESSQHAGTACTVCHPEATSFNHGKQEPGDCTQCHLPHDEKVAHDAHVLVSCGGCHLQGIEPVRDSVSKHVIWERGAGKGETSSIHEMITAYDESRCQRCHASGNQVGAASMILPAKSILCMPCHAATFSIGDTTTILALIFFAVGMVMIFSYTFSGSVAGEQERGALNKVMKIIGEVVRNVFSSRVLLIIKALFLDVLLQRRLYRQSVKRWAIHSLIFFPFVFRFLWGLIALLGSLWKPEWTSIWAMLDKNHPTTGLIFDLTGIMIILGLVFAFVRGGMMRRSERAPGLPKQDRIALTLIAGIVVIGFVVEGMRIAMTGHPEGAAYAFLGYGISQLFADSFTLTRAYGYVWYGHAILTGAFFAYMPFSRLVHMIMAPLVLAMNAAMEQDHKTRG
jgi:nitrate reductase gamma subunit